MPRTIVVVFLATAFSSRLLAQISTEEAYQRLAERQRRQQTTSASTLPVPGAATRPAQPDALEAVASMTTEADRLLSEEVINKDEIQGSLDRLFERHFRLDSRIEGVTTEVPVGDKGLFGDRPNRAMLIKLDLPRPNNKSARLGLATTRPAQQDSSGVGDAFQPRAELYLYAPDAFLDRVRKGETIHGDVQFNHGEIDPAGRGGTTRPTYYAGTIKLLGTFKPDEPPPAPPPAVADVPRSIPAPVVDPLAPIRSRRDSSRRVVFVCRASGSMLSLWSGVRRSLHEACQSLGPGQMFTVILFQKSSYIALDEHLVPATPTNKLKADDLLERVAPRDTGNPIAALETAFKETPNVIYFITNTQPFPDDLAVLECVRKLNSQRVVHVNTIAFAPASDAGDGQPAQILRKIARENGGEFRLFTQ